MSKLYAVVQVWPERHYDYKMDEIRESFSVGLPYVFDDRKKAYESAEAKRKAKVPCFDVPRARKMGRRIPANCTHDGRGHAMARVHRD